MRTPKFLAVFISLSFVPIVFAQAPLHVEMAKVESRSLSRTVPLTAELTPYLQTDIEARVPGYVERVLVDRGSMVRRGQLLVQLSAPEMGSQTSASEAVFHQAEAEVSQAEAQAAAAGSTYERMAEAAKTPGAIAGNELLQAQKQKEATDALVQSRKAAAKTASDRLKATESLQGYLGVKAPFDGVVTERFVHPGTMVEQTGRQPLLRLEQVSHLRLVVPVPETYVASISLGKAVVFRIPAQPSKSFTGTVARIPRSLDPQSRTMMVELDVSNKGGLLAPGMYPTVDWPVSSSGSLLFVPITSVVTTTQRAFVITNVNGHAHWVDVQKGPASGEYVSVRGALSSGQQVVKRATDEIREGTALR
jgi:membrane fusion protein (multidrug efflux system)